MMKAKIEIKTSIWSLE